MDKDKLFEQSNHSASAQKMCQQSSAKKQKRRMLLKGGAALPVVMTLYSGAALARTSNIIGAAGPGDEIAKQSSVDQFGGDRVICLHPDPSKQIQESDGSAPPYDLGPTPSGHLEQNSFIDQSGITQPLDDAQQAMNCQTKGGIVVSTVAFMSIWNKSGVTIDPNL